MELVKRKTTVPYSSVGADGEQSLKEITNSSITIDTTECKSSEPDFYEMFSKRQRLYDPAYLSTVSMQDLYETIYPGRQPIIDGLLYAGIYLFVGAPKVGKSFLVAQIGYHVSTGLPLWGYPVRQGAVLYLALEDDHRRLQERLFRMFGAESADKLYFSIYAKLLGAGLEEQLKWFVQEHPDMRLIMIDTLQKVRETSGEKYSYASDYEVITKLKAFADEHNICLLLVHHTRKQQSEDKFDMISGTNGLLGAADGAFLLQKERRTSNTATLDISGSDQQDQRLYLTRDEERLVWTMERTETELWKDPSDPVLEAVAALVTPEQPCWSGTATELVAVLGLDMKPNALAMRLNVRAGKFLCEYGIRYESHRSHAGRTLSFILDSLEA